MYRAEAGWLAASSFVEPVAPPGVEPDSTPGVSVCFSAAWLPYVLGSLQQMCQPAAWDTSDPAVLQATLDRAQGLLELFGTAGGCMLLRWSDADCALEVSTDNGATWAPISGWDIAGVASCLEVHLPPPPIVRWNATDCVFQVSTDNGATYVTLPGFTIASLAACLQQPLIDIGGTPGTGFDGPGNPGGISTAQMACNIAAWLAVEILQGSMSSIATSLGALSTTLETADAIFKLAASFTGVGGAFFTVMGILIPAATAIGETALNTAGSDAGLRSDLICAIYSAISADGKVTPANVATIVSNINGISYGTPGIVGMLKDYVSNLGYTGLNAIQSEGSLYGGNCACGSTPIPGGNQCAIFNGSSDYADFAGAITSGATEFTVMAWVRPATFHFGMILFSMSNNANTDEFFYRVADDATPSEIPEFARGNTGGNVWTGESNNPIPLNVWTHFAVKAGPATNVITCYINGTAVGTTVIGPNATGLDAAIRTVMGAGWLSTGAFQFYDGKLADVRVYATLLTDPQIAAVAAGGVTGYVVEGSPVDWWALNDASGGTIHDYGSGGHDLTWHGSGGHWSTV